MSAAARTDGAVVASLTAEERGLAAELWSVIEPQFDPAFTRLVRRTTGQPDLVLPAEAIRFEKRRNELLYQGAFGEEYLAHVRESAVQFVKMGFQMRDFVYGFSVYEAEMMDLVVKAAGGFRFGRRRTDLAARLKVLLKLSHIDCSVVSDFFVTELAEASAAQRATLAEQFEARVKSVADAVASQAGRLHDTAASLLSGAESAVEQCSKVETSAGETSRNVETVASASEQLAASIAEISAQVAQSADLSRDAVEEARRTNAIVGSLVEAAGRIGTVVSLIDGIASQTNLLALNATIEAARAGDAGKGFAVVAGEVKHLATETAKATGEIVEQISGIQTATRQAVQAIEAIAGRIGRINEVSATVAAAVQEQGSATREITTSIQRVAGGARDVSSTIGAIGSASSATVGNSGQVRDASQLLSDHSRKLLEEVDLFVRNIRAG